MNMKARLFRLRDEVFEINADRDDYRIVLALIVMPVLLAISYYYGKPAYYLRELKPSAIALLGADFEYLKMLPYAYMSGILLITRILIPVLIIVYIFKDKLNEYGWKITGISKHIPIYFALYLLCLPFIYIASLQDSFLNSYPFYRDSMHGGWHFWAYEAVYMIQFACVEAFFRGFLLFVLFRKFGYYAVLILLTPYCMIHFGKPFPEVIASILTGAILGFLALRTGSFYLGAVLHMGVAFTMDIAALYQKGFL